MVDGPAAERPSYGGIISLQLCPAARGEFCPSQPVNQSYGALGCLSYHKPHVGSKEAEDSLPKAVPSAQGGSCAFWSWRKLAVFVSCR